MGACIGGGSRRRGGGGGWELIRDYIVVTVTKLKDAEKCLLTASRLPPSSCLDPVPVKKTRTYWARLFLKQLQFQSYSPSLALIHHIYLYRATISDNNIGQWLPFPQYPLPNVVLQVQKNNKRKVDIIVATLKEGKRGRAFFWGWPQTFG